MRNRLRLWVLLAGLGMIIASANAAWAAATGLAPLAAPNTWQVIVDWTVANIVLPVLALAIPGIVGLLMTMLVQWLRKHGIELDQAKQAQFNDAAIKALEWATTQVLSKIEARGPEGWRSADIHQEVINKAKDYMLDKFPTATANGIGTTDIVATGRLLQPVMTRLLPRVITEVAASPATPEAPPSNAAVPVVDVGPKT